MATRSAPALPRSRKAQWRFAWIVHLIPGGAAFLFFWIAVVVLDPRPPFTLSQGFVVNSPVRPGDVVKVDWTQTWSRRCRAESVRSVVRSDRKVDTYEKAIIYPPAKVGDVHAIAEAQLSKVTPPGPAIYRSKITFPAQLSWTCVMPWAVTFATPDVSFVVAKAE